MGYSNILGFFSVTIEVAMISLNLLFLYASGYVKAKRDKTEIDEILISHSACTICFILFSTPFGLMTYFRSRSDGGIETCAIYQVSAIWYQILCTFVITCLSVNCVRRGQILIKSQFVHRIWSRSLSYVIIIATLLISLNIAILPALGLAPEIRNLTDLNKTCHLWIALDSKDQKQHVFSITYLVIGYFHFLCLLVCQPIIFHYIRRVKRQLCIDMCSQETNFLLERDVIRRRFIDGSRMVALVAAMFYFSWIPNLVMVTLDKAGHVVSETAILYATLGTTMTGLLNPLAYAYWDKSYRNGYKKAVERVLNVCTCNKFKTDNTPVVTLKTTSISHNTANSDTACAENTRYNATSALFDRSDYETVNPACRDIVNDMCDRQTTSEDNPTTPLTGDTHLATRNTHESHDDFGATDTYSIDSESEIFITERRLDILEDDERTRLRAHRRISESTESSLDTVNDSLEFGDSDNERHIDESRM